MGWVVAVVAILKGARPRIALVRRGGDLDRGTRVGLEVVAVPRVPCFTSFSSAALTDGMNEEEGMAESRWDGVGWTSEISEGVISRWDFLVVVVHRQKGRDR